MNTNDLIDRAHRLAEHGSRRILGITGAPGAGKTTIARDIVDKLGPYSPYWSRWTASSAPPGGTSGTA